MSTNTKGVALGKLKVDSIMSKHVETLMFKDSISDALGMMIDNGLTTAPVVNADNKCIGILSRSDLTTMLMDEDGELARLLDSSLSFGRFCQSLETCESRQVSELMTYEVQTVKVGTSVVDACKLMAELKVHHLPVTDDSGKVVGIISASDIVNAVANSE